MGHDLKKNSVDLIGLNSLTKWNVQAGFWHYTRKEYADGILASKCFHIGCVKNMNDVKESHKREADQEKIFGLCFCNTNTDMIPMWYLYSGIAGDGISIGLTAKSMRELLEGITTVYAITKQGQKRIALKRDVDFKLEYGWVFYRKVDAQDEVMYRGKWYKLTDGPLNDESNYFVKDYPWYYEKEFRLVFTTNDVYDHLQLEIPDKIYKALQLRLAPEYSEAQITELFKLNGFKTYFKHKLIKSKLGIQFCILEKNASSFVDYVRTEQEKIKNEPGYHNEHIATLKELLK